MASHPRHEALRGIVTEVPGEGSGAAFGELELERYLVDNSGRIDVAWGATVIELRSDLLREERDVVARMPDDLAPAALHAGEVASCVSLPDDMHFTGKRRLIRQALDADGVAETIERLVDALLPV